jgi:hypothetical protein
LVPSDLGTLRLASLTTAPTVELTPVPPPACQNLSSRTPYGKAVTLRLACTELARRPLTYAIIGAPAHGTLSTVTPPVQVTYTPDAGFRGTDSFTYAATSADGTSNVASVSIAVSPPSVAKAGHARAKRSAAEIPVSCRYSGGGVGPSCDITVTATVTEILRGDTLQAVTSTKSKRPTETTKVVVVAHVSLVVAADKARVVQIRLNRRGEHLLSAHGKLSVSLVVTQTFSRTTGVVSHQRVTLSSGGAKHSKTR